FLNFLLGQVQADLAVADVALQDRIVSPPRGIADPLGLKAIRIRPFELTRIAGCLWAKLARKHAIGGALKNRPFGPLFPGHAVAGMIDIEPARLVSVRIPAAFRNALVASLFLWNIGVVHNVADGD